MSKNKKYRNRRGTNNMKNRIRINRKPARGALSMINDIHIPIWLRAVLVTIGLVTVPVAPAVAQEAGTNVQPTTATAAVCTTGVDASINGMNVTFRNWNGTDCPVSAVSYTRDGDTKYPQTRTALNTGTVKANGQLVLSFNGTCEQHDAINGADAPGTLTGEYFTPAGTLLTADDSGLWLTSCNPPKVEHNVSINGTADCTSWSTQAIATPDGAKLTYNPAQSGTWNGNGTMTVNVTATWNDGSTANSSTTLTGPGASCNPTTEYTCPGTNRIVSDLASCVETPRSSKG